MCITVRSEPASDPLDEPGFNSTSVVDGKYPVPRISPRDFELRVKEVLDRDGFAIPSYRSEHLEVVAASDGEYEFDVTARFSALGVDFVVVVECKAYKASVKRDEVQKLLMKMQSVGAHKGILFSTSGFQSGAIKFAKAHGIALIQLADGRSRYFAKAFDDDGGLAWEQVPVDALPIACWVNRRSVGIADRR